MVDLAILEPNHDCGHGKVVQYVKGLWIYQDRGRRGRFCPSLRGAEDDSGHNLNLAEMGPEITRCNMENNTEQSEKKRTWIARAALESALAETVRESDSRCEGLIEIIVERVVPGSPDGANWAVKGVKYGKAEREPCSAAISKFVEESQSEFEVSDWT